MARDLERPSASLNDLSQLVGHDLTRSPAQTAEFFQAEKISRRAALR